MEIIRNILKNLLKNVIILLCIYRMHNFTHFYDAGRKGHKSMKKKIIGFIVLTFMSATLTYTNSIDLMSLMGSVFLIMGFNCVLAAICNKYLYLLSALTTCIFGILGGGAEGGIFAAVILSGAFVAGALAKKGTKTSQLIQVTAISFFLAVIAVIMYKTHITGTNIITSGLEMTKENFIVMFEEYIKTLGEVEINVPQIADEIYTVLQNIIPAILIIASLIVGFLSCCLSSFIFRIFRMNNLYKVTFSRFSVDKITVMVFLLATVLTYVLKDGIGMVAAVNVFLILLFVLQICGLSLLDSILKRRGVITPFRFFIIFITLVFFTGVLPVILFTGMGILDAFKDFRHLNTPDDNNQ